MNPTLFKARVQWDPLYTYVQGRKTQKDKKTKKKHMHDENVFISSLKGTALCYQFFFLIYN